MKLKSLLALSAALVTTSGAFAQWTKPVPATQALDETSGAVQYLMNVGTGKFMLGANDYSTRASVSDKGYKWKIWVQDDPTYVSFADSLEAGTIAGKDSEGWGRMFAGGASDVWVDNVNGANVNTWKIEKGADNTFKITNDGEALVGEYLGAQSDGADTRLYFTSYFTTAGIDASYDWTSVSVEAYNAYLTAYNTYEKALALKKAIDDAQTAYPTLDLAAENAVYNDATSTIDKITEAIASVAEKKNTAAQNSATAADPKDMSSLITNADFASDKSGWSGTAWGGYTDATVEQYNKTFDTYQVVENMPAGIYALSSQAFYRAGYSDVSYTNFKDGTGKNAMLYGENLAAAGTDTLSAPILNPFLGVQANNSLGGNESKVAVGDDTYYIPNNMSTAATYFGAGYYTANQVLFPVTEGKAQIGIRKTTTITGDWTIVNNFGLKYYGNGADAWQLLMDDYTKNQSIASDAIVTKKIASDFKEMLSAAKATDLDSYKAQVAAIKAAKVDVDANIAAWSGYKTKYDEGEVYLKDSQWAQVCKKHNLGDYLGYYESDVEDLAYTTADVIKYTNDLDSVIQAVQGDTPWYTEIPLKNNDFANGWTGWEHSGTGGNVATNTGAKCAEAWNSSNFDIHQEVSNAPAGLYKITLQGFYRYLRGDNAWLEYFNENGTKKTENVKDYITNTPAMVYLNDCSSPMANVFDYQTANGDLYTTTGDLAPYIDPNKQYWYPNDMTAAGQAFDQGAYAVSAYGLVENKGDLVRIGVKGNSNQGNDSWAIFTRFHLIYEGEDAAIGDSVLYSVMPRISAAVEGKNIGTDVRANTVTVLTNGKNLISSEDGAAKVKAISALYKQLTAIDASVAKFDSLSNSRSTLESDYAKYSGTCTKAARDAAEALYSKISAGLEIVSTGSGEYTNADADADQIALVKVLKDLRDNADWENASDTNPVDQSSIIANNDFEQGNLDGWTVASGTGDTGAKDNTSATYIIQNDDTKYVFNTWSSAAPEGGFILKQVLDTPHAGTYQLSCLVASDKGNMVEAFVETADGVYFGDSIITTVKDTADTVSFYFKVEEGQNATINLLSKTWFKADEFKLTYFGNNSAHKADSYTLGIEDVVTDFSPVSVQYFNISGMRMGEARKGLNIVRMTDASGRTSVKKILEK